MERGCAREKTLRQNRYEYALCVLREATIGKIVGKRGRIDSL
jgi:predicted RNA-binding protein YlqC (UPF0109 family)